MLLIQHVHGANGRGVAQPHTPPAGRLRDLALTSEKIKV